ncbi:regulator of G-protein signaling 5 isoform X2 [Electrophorus electricus]|uniref:regulator of G-protein signaling 5 isoform X2 n=1 Tax=Electrophorus electricus TaxID=8005 RepID=UPI000F09FABF|nr:regulator of G-protein signaling 5 isoform X2 [Electrophorus electricus]
MCKGLSAIPSSCLEKAKGMRVKLTHLAEKPHKHRSQEEKPPQDLESLLSSKTGLQAFRWFLRSEFSEENLAFWLACQDYRNTPEPKRATKALNIYSRFINSDAPQEVNLDGQTREALLGSQDEAAADVFDSAQQRIFTLMAKDSFPRFLRSSHCRDLLRAL